MIWLCIVYLIMGVGVLDLMCFSDYKIINMWAFILPVLFWPLILIALNFATFCAVKDEIKNSQK